MFGEILLAAWSAAGLSWSLLAWRLVRREGARSSATSVSPQPSDPRSLSIFKPLPRLHGDEWKEIATGITSFVAQLDAQTELLLGIHEANRECTLPFISHLRKTYPRARLKIVYRSTPDDMANPKIAWQKILSAQETGELWLWSDADIIAPPDFLVRARAEFAQCGAAMLTFPYTIRDIPQLPGLLEAIFVNVEFYPGVLLLRKRGPVDFGLGAGTLFARDDFEERVAWDELGASLADDFVLGQRLGPVQVSGLSVITLAGARTWREAAAHDLRWTKTVRWNRPWGFFGRIATMPLLGWLIYVGWYPQQPTGWLGFLSMLALEVILAAAICRAAGCRLKALEVLALVAWTFWRIALWCACWWPGAVTWNGRVWKSARSGTVPLDLSPASSLTEPVDNPVRNRDLFAAKRTQTDVAPTQLVVSGARDVTLRPAAGIGFSPRNGHDSNDALEQRAGALRDEVFGRTVFVRGVVEVSNFCRQNCNYCGMRRDNRSLKRFRLELESLRELIRHGLPDVITDLNIQTGEDVIGDREIVLPLIETIRRERPNLGISVCLGTLDFKLYDELKAAGASYYIIKMETGNRDHYASVRAPGTYEKRLEAIRYLAATGWSVSSGFILGLPGQTPAHVEETLDLLGSLPLAGASVSPFISGEQTPFAGHNSGNFEQTMRCIALLRLRNPSYIIPAISALNLVQEGGYVRALRAGANLATINLTPATKREDYLLYKRGRFIMHEQRVTNAIAEAGCAISTTSIAKTMAARRLVAH